MDCFTDGAESLQFSVISEKKRAWREQYCIEHAEIKDLRILLEIFAQETDDVVGLYDAHHAALMIDHGQGVKVVLVE